MDILRVLKKFAQMTQSEQAWVMATLLDFRDRNLERFTTQYGTYAKELIADLIDPI